jgi:hypothetical protein
MEYKNLEEINKTLKTTDIKGKDYIEVNERIKAFWQLCPNGRIETSIYSIENGVCIIKAYVYENKEDERPRATGTAYEKEGSTFINKTSYIENCETSAVGRALGNAGIGIDTSVASAEEVQNAIIQQDSEKVIDKTKVQALNKSIENAGIKDEVVELILSQYGYTSTSEIKVKDYNSIVADFKSKKE